MHNIHSEKLKYHNLCSKYCSTTGNYHKFKKALRESFNKCCGYCGMPIDENSQQAHIDHFIPIKIINNSQLQDNIKKRLINDYYKNLVYSCLFCNQGKSGDWPSGNVRRHVKDGKGYLHPILSDYNKHLYRDDDGFIQSDSDIGNYMIRRLKLWELRHPIIWLKTMITDLHDKYIENLNSENSENLKEFQKINTKWTSWKERYK